MIDRFHHVLVTPKDYEKSLAFYRDQLGWTVTRSWGGDGEDRGAILSGGGMKVVIAEGLKVKGARDAEPIVHLDIHDIDARFKKLAPGTEVVLPPQETRWGTRWFVVRDPDGNLIAFEEVHGGPR
jgi:catechol 2,3-dioxygenase-like lactoylglutathione lyase family enzyme